MILFGLYEWKNKNNKPISSDININTNLSISDEQKELLECLVGLESKEIKVLDNPLRIDGTFYIPEETVLTFINYYLKTTKNKDIDDIGVVIDENGMTIEGKYKLIQFMKTPIDIDILPIITEDKDLKLYLKDIRVLNLSLGEDIINAIIDSWFSDMNYITVESGDIVINKEFFKNTDLNSISVEEDNLILDLSIKLK